MEGGEGRGLTWTGWQKKVAGENQGIPRVWHHRGDTHNPTIPIRLHLLPEDAAAAAGKSAKLLYRR